MLGAILGLLLVAGRPAAPDPASLVVELGSSRYLQREAAEAALTSLGRAAIPALRAAHEARDPEVRNRASAILSRIEDRLLVQPTPIALDFHDVPVADALRTINFASGLKFRLATEDAPLASDARLTVRTSEPLPFWKGLDTFCEAARLHYDFGAPSRPGRDDSSFPLYLGYTPPPDPVSDSGPFRTHLASVHCQSEIVLSPSRVALTARAANGRPSDEAANAKPVATRQFYLQLLVAAEPRLSITQNGAPRVVEAVDDQGGSLLIPAESSSLQHTSGYYGMNPSPVVRYRVDLAYPEVPGRRIARLRGAMPVIAATRKPDPLRFEVHGSVGKTFRSPDVELTIRKVASPPDGGPTTMELTLKPLGIAPAVGPAEVDPLAARLESPHQQMEILGPRGEPIAWFPANLLFNGEETRLTLTLMSEGRAAEPTTIVYHGMTRASIEVPFTFRDIPIP